MKVDELLELATQKNPFETKRKIQTEENRKSAIPYSEKSRVKREWNI